MTRKILTAQSLAELHLDKDFVQGRVEGRADILLELLDCRFGPLSAQMVSAVRTLLPERLQEITPLVLTVQSLAELHLD